eukprot:TRINITY_DN36828_c0_g1_i1.p1 TRINITY_DN36828_c0_g1~~TRINITY_DN36828_c0_g1_i1.p1  ORF type:complete len:638 (+),score=76.29 TRINITY_DN36828_c0_g1_i1:129-1916(+)
MADLESMQSGGGGWMKDAVQEAISQSQSTLSMVHGMSLGIKAEIEKPPVRIYYPLTSPGAVPEPSAESLSPGSVRYYGGVTESPPRRKTHKSVLSPAVPRTVLSPPKRKAPSGGNKSNKESSTSSVARQSWNRFCRVASDQFTNTELAAVSLETLKGLLRHYSLRDPIECARIEVYWRLLSIQRETKAEELPLKAAPSVASPAKVRSGTPTRKSVQRSGSGNSFTPLEHPRPFEVTPLQKGPHLSRRGSLRHGPARSCNPNRSTSSQYTWRTHSPGRSGIGSAGEKPSLRTYSADSRSISQPVAYSPSSIPSNTPSSSIPSKISRIKTFPEAPVAGSQTWESSKRSGKKTTDVCNSEIQAAQRKSPGPVAIKTFVEKQTVTDVTSTNTKSKNDFKGVKVNEGWRTDHLGISSVEIKNTQPAIRGRKSVAQPAPTQEIIAPSGLKCLGGQLPAVSDPNPNKSATFTSDRNAKSAQGLRVHAPHWSTSHHKETVQLGGKKPSSVRAEGVQPPEHVEVQRRLHDTADLHPPVPTSTSTKEIKAVPATTTPLTPTFTPSSSAVRSASLKASKRSGTPTKKKYPLVPRCAVPSFSSSVGK